MRKTIHICDRCKKEEIIDTYGEPKGWKTITVQFDNKTYVSYYSVCPECLEKLGIKEKINTETKEERVTLADRLLDIVQEIVYNQQV
jgi:hypothetical protein